MDLFEKGRVFVRDVTCLFEKRDGERRKCPRCRGSGLLNCGRLWQWDRRPSGNQACWFCEGVGVMPLFGLNGFMLGRATAAINTADFRNPVVTPFPTHLYLGKYPCTKSKFTSSNPTQNMSSLLHKPSSMPRWLTDAAEELALQSFDESAATSEEVQNFSTSILTDQFNNCQKVAVQYRKAAPSESSTARSRYVQLDVRGDNTRHLDASSTTLNMEAQPTAGEHRITAGGRSRIRTRHKSGQARSSYSGLSFRERIFEHKKMSLSMNNVGGSNQSFGSMGSEALTRPEYRFRNLRYARRRRNHIRVKMERLTTQNSSRMQKLLLPKLEEPAPSDSPDALQGFTGNWKDLSQKCLAELTASGAQSKRSRFNPLGPTSKYPSLTNQPFYGKLVGKLQLLPAVVKPLQW